MNGVHLIAEARLPNSRVSDDDELDGTHVVFSSQSSRFLV